MKTIKNITLAFFFFFSSFNLLSAQGNKTDFFAEIGNKVQNERMGLLEEKKPLLLPEKFLFMEQVILPLSE